MVLVIETGPILAAYDRGDARHRACAHLIETSREPLVVPAPVLVELDYWFARHLGPLAMVTFLDDVSRGAFRVENLTEGGMARVRDIRTRYADSAIGFVDAAVLAVVERLNEPKLATTDHRHFRMLRPRHVAALELLTG